MIITCPCNKKKFEVDASLIPDNGRNIQCGACDHVWFYKKSDQNQVKINKIETEDNIDISDKNIQSDNTLSEPFIRKEKISKKKGSEIVKYKAKSSFTLGKLLSYIIVAIITSIGLIIILDTFKGPLYTFLPNLEFWLFNLYEILKDIQLFIKDLF